MNLNNVVNILLKKVPEFSKSVEFAECSDETGLPYVIFGRFTDYVIKLVKERNNVEKEKVCIFLEEMATSDNQKIVELLMFGFLENLNPKENYYSSLVSFFGVETTQKLRETFDHNNKLSN